MEVYAVTVCCDDEYGFMDLCGIFSTEEKALQYIKKSGLQTKYETCLGGDFRTDFAVIEAWPVE